MKYILILLLLSVFACGGGGGDSGEGSSTADSEEGQESIVSATYSEHPDKDVFVSSYYSGDNYADNVYGSIEQLYVAYYDPEDEFAQRFRTFIYFDTCSIPGDATIDSATLSLSTSDYIVGSPKVKIQRVGASWDDELITWDNQPLNFSAPSVDTQNLVVDQSYVFNVIELISDCGEDRGFVLIGGTLDNLIRFHSGEVWDVNLRPKLTINYRVKL